MTMHRCIAFGNNFLLNFSLSLIFIIPGLILQGQLFSAIDFVIRHENCLFDVVLLSTVRNCVLILFVFVL